MKKIIYHALFVILGILLSTLAHALIELPIIKLLLSDFKTYSLGLSWRQWYAIHDTGGAILFFLGAYLGFLQGKRWWRKIYIEHRPRKECHPW